MANSSSSVPPAQGGKRTPLFVLGILALVVVVLACAGALWWVSGITRRVTDQQTVVVGQDQFVPGTPAGLRVVVREGTSGRTIPDASVQVSMRSPGREAQVLYTGRTDTLGSANLTFTVPADVPADTELIIETSSKAGTDRIVRSVKSVRPARLLLTTDKPVYQPGQVIHMRALALAAFDFVPMSGAEVQWLVEDAKGNKVLRQSAFTSDYGIAAADFALADEVNQGAYRVSATLGEAQAEKTVQVKWYVLPKFRVELTTERSFYLPGEVVQGHIQADYFFGKPVAGGQVQITGATYDVERRVVSEARGTTDANGGFDFTLAVPDYLVGSAKETAPYTLEASVIDQADHSEQTTQELTVARQAILIEAVAESGQLRPGVENIVYILTSYPDGSPAETTVQVTFAGRKQELVAGEEGVVELRIQPESGGQSRIEVVAQDANGRTGYKSVDLEASAGADQVLLRPDRPVYRVGETMHLEAFAAGRTRTVYLDVVKERQTLHMQAADIQDGKATFDVEVTQDLVGTLELNAYHVQGDGSLVRDTRIVVVNMPTDIDVAMSADKETYRPGEVAKLVFTLSRQGSPVAGAVGLSIVDESVFSVEEQDPGFARLIFLLEADLLKPRYQIKDTLQPILTEPQPGEPAAPPSQQQLASAQAALAAAPGLDLAWLINSFAEKLAGALREQVQAFSKLRTWFLWALCGLAVALASVVHVTLRRRGLLDKVEGPFWEDVVKVFFLSIVIVPVGAILLIGLYQTVKLGVVVLFVVAWLVCLLLLWLDAVERRDEAVQFVVLLVATWAMLCLLMVYGAAKARAADSGSVWLMALVGVVGLAGLHRLGLGLKEEGAQDGARAARGLVALTIPTLALLVMAIPAFARSTLGSLLDPRTACGPVGWLTGCAAAPMRTGTPAPQVPAQPAEKDQGRGLAAASAVEAPRLRQYFPETLYWNPEAISDESGRLVLEVPLADSITTWRLSAQASTARGELGGLTAGLRVFQDFFVDLDLPVALTENDEIAVPVSVFNYLTAAQKVRLELKQESWFDLLDASSKTLDIGPNEVTSVYFRIRAREFGRQKLTVTAWGERMSDAIAREIRVVPDGKQVLKTASSWLRDGTTGMVRIPQNAIPGTAKIAVKVYPGFLSQVVEGLDALLRLPYG